MAGARWPPVPCLGLPDHQWPPHPAATTLPLSKSPHHLRDQPPQPNHRENRLPWREHFFPSGNPRYFELREGGKVRTHGGAGRGPLSLLSLLQLSPIQLERNAAALYETRRPARPSPPAAAASAGHIEPRNPGFEARDSRLGAIA